jgi:hypothetical protein
LNSGVKGLNGVAVDAGGEMVGFELESANIALRDPRDGIVLEVNHWQDAGLQAPARRHVPDFFRKSYYFNSQARVYHHAHQHEALRRLRTLDDLLDYFSRVAEPGRLLQLPETSIGGWSSVYGAVMSAKTRSLRVFPFPIVPEHSRGLSLAGVQDAALAAA